MADWAGLFPTELQKGSTSDTVAAVVVAPGVTALKAGSGVGEAVAGAGCVVPGTIGMGAVPGMLMPASPSMMICPA